MQVTIKVEAGTPQEGGKVIKRVMDAMKLSYNVEFVGDERSTGRNASTITSTRLLVEHPFVGGVRLDADLCDKPLEQVEELLGVSASYAIDPLDSAIESTVRMMRDERESEAGQQGIRTVLFQRLSTHLDDLTT
ncbi:hypothetical protein [Pseudomonas sp. Z13]|uniref:hypothetical protein n=1 Tax=Pseudomonas sp. Z13 TaxID=2983409 RepID=UPI002E822157|nr:hypothetical protein [Pseudomonas sp. Z13]